MRIHGLCMVKDEADVVEECLRAAAVWCDHIYVFDNGSVDGTWEIVQRLAAQLPAIVAWRHEAVPFTDGLRAEIYEAFRGEARPGDWWCRVDADEFYVDDPRAFLAAVPERDRVVWTASLSYYLTDRDAERHAADPEAYGDGVPVAQKIRYYVNHWSEPRFFRHRRGLTWNDDTGFPPEVHTWRVHPRRIVLKHYPYRSPQQIERRLAVRSEAVARGVFEHEAIADWGTAVASVRETRALLDRTAVEHTGTQWRERIVPADTLDFDALDGRLAINEDLMPPLPEPAPLRRRLAARLRDRLRG